MSAPRDDANVPRPALTWRLGEGPKDVRGEGVVNALDALACLSGVVLNREAHAEFLRRSGVLRAVE
jgi:hypothetical protein